MRTILLKSLLITTFLMATKICKSQKNTPAEGITAQVSFLGSYQEKSSKLPTNDTPNGQFIWNHQLYYQYQYLITERIEFSVGFGLNYSYYSLDSGVSLDRIRNSLQISDPLLPLENDDKFLKARFNNLFLTAPIGLRFYLKENTKNYSQPAFSFQFLTERLINSRVNARYTTDGKIIPTRSNTSSIDSEIENFYQQTTTKWVYSLRGGVGVKFKHQETKFPKSHFEVQFIYFFTPYNEGLITQAFGISFGWKWYFQK